MLIRCQADDLRVSFTRARVLSQWFAVHYRIAIMVPKDHFEIARAFIGSAYPIYRLPDGEEAEAERIQMLHRKHHHRILLLDRPDSSSSFLFRLHRIFDHLTVFDPKVSGLIHGNVLLNDSFTAAGLRYDCSSGLKLLLGPKFHITQPNAPLPPAQTPLTHLLICLRDEALIKRLLELLAPLRGVPQIHVLCQPEAGIRRELTLIKQRHPHLDLSPVLMDDNGPFPYERYPFVISEADGRCPMFARNGQFFINLAAQKEQLTDAYTLNQLGISPTMGWLESKSDPELSNLLQNYLEDPARRRQFATAAAGSIDGKALSRLAHFIPAEAKPDC